MLNPQDIPLAQGLLSGDQVAWLDLAPLEEVFELSGAEHRKFLNAYTTQDILKQPEGKASPGAFLTQKGKLIASAEILLSPERAFLFIPRGFGEKLLSHLQTFLMFSSAALRDVSADYFHGLLLGKAASTAWPSLCPHPPQGLFVWEGTRFGCPALEILGPKNQENAWLPALHKHPSLSLQILETLRLEAGIPKLGVDMGEENLVAEVGLDKTATNFNKGCYLGQETTARVQSMGHVNRRLTRLQLANPFAGSLPQEIHQGDKVVGRLTSYAPGLQGVSLGLGLLQRQALENPTGLHIKDGDRQIAITIIT